MEIQSYLSIRNAAEYLDIDLMQLKLLIADGELHVGLYAKNWVGVAIPNPKTLKDKPDIQVSNITPKGKQIYLLKYAPKTRTRIMRKEVLEYEARKFWYLDSDSASLIINSIRPRKSDTVSLKSPNGDELKHTNPEQFPFDEVLLETCKSYRQLGIRKLHLRLLKTDLDLIAAKIKAEKEKILPSLLMTQFNIPYEKEVIARSMKAAFYTYIKCNLETPDSESLWQFMVQEPAKSIHYDSVEKRLVFADSHGKREGVKFKAFDYRFSTYIKKKN